MRFLSVEGVHFLHQLSIEEFGGTLGLRDAASLESAVFHPQNVAIYGGGDISMLRLRMLFTLLKGNAFLMATSARLLPRH